MAAWLGLLVGAGIAAWPLAARASALSSFDVCADAGEDVVVYVAFKAQGSRRIEVTDLPSGKVVKTFDNADGATQHWRGPEHTRRACYRITSQGVATSTGAGEWQFEDGSTVIAGSKNNFAAAAVIGAVLGAILSDLWPRFSPWPPPEATARRVIPRALVTGRAAGTWGEVADRFDSALDKAGYTDLSYYAVPDGFAIATRVERIESDGTSAPDTARWADVETQRQWTLETLLRELVGAPIGHYRTIVFVFSPDAFQLDGSRITEAQAERWRSGGVDRLPVSLRGLAYGAGFRCDALIYEFQKRDQAHPAVFVPGGLPAEIHLSRSRILDALGQLP